MASGTPKCSNTQGKNFQAANGLPSLISVNSSAERPTMHVPAFVMLFGGFFSKAKMSASFFFTIA
jgi:hypothetical protein